MPTDKDNLPTVGSATGRTIDATTKVGEFTYQEADSPDEMLEIAGIGDDCYDEKIIDRLPAKADLLDDGRLRAKNNRDGHNYDFLNQNRRAILQRLDDGDSPLEVAEELDFNDSFVYRTRAVFNFLLEDSFLKEKFVDDGGEYAPAFDPKEETEEEEEEETVPIEEAREMAEKAYENGLEEGKEQTPDEGEKSDTALFTGEEWWEIMKALMENGEEEYARRVADEIDFG